MSSTGKKKKIRQGHRAYVSKILGNVRDLTEEYDPSNENKLKQLKISLQERLVTLKSLDEEILDAVEDDDEITAEIEDSGKFSEHIHGAIVEIDSLLSTSKTNVEDVPSGSSHTITTQKTGSKWKYAKLPKLVLETFSGEPSQWQSFWNSYESAIHQNEELSDVDKFNYLKGLLKGSAASTIAGLPLSKDNYAAAVELLQQRFGNKQVIISSHMDSLLKIKSVSSSTDVAKLRQMYDKIETHVRGLQALQVPTESYGSLLIPVLMNKIPDDIRILVARQIKDGEWSLDEILRLLGDEIKNRERCEGIKAIDISENREKNNASHRFRKDPPTLSALFTEEKETTINCTFCKQRHPTASCQVVTNKAARKQILMKQGRCFKCLRRNHVVRNCRSNYSCQKCAGKHHVSICDSEEQQRKTDLGASPEQKPEQGSGSQPSGKKINAGYVGSRNSVLLQTAQAYIGKEESTSGVRVRVIFDSGSQKSFIKASVRDQLKLPTITKETLLINTFGNGKTDHGKICDRVQLTVGDVGGNSSTKMEAYVVPEICAPINSQEINRAIHYYPHLKEIKLADSNHGNGEMEIDLLIGADYTWSFFSGEVLKGENEYGPVASKTSLGWVLSGPIPQENKKKLSNVNFVSTHVLKVAECQDKNPPAEEMLHRLWDIESIGIREKETVHESFLKNVTFQDQRYSVSLPLKEKHELLPDNYEVSLARLNSLVKRLRKEPPVLEEYNKIIEEQLHQGIIERVDEPEEQPTGQIHYLPHQAVIRKEAVTTKIRVVFDASSKVPNHPSLNDCTHTGPSLTPAILDILLRFRGHKVGLVADIEKAFLNIAVEEKQRNLMRFLWLNDVNAEDPSIVIYRFARVIFGMNCSPFLLNATLQHHVSQYYEKVPFNADSLLAALYVDDWTSGAEDESKAYELYHETNECFSAGNFHLRKWASNSKAVIDKIKQDRVEREETEKINVVSKEEESYAKTMVGGLDEIEPTKEHKVLGLNWNLESDTIILKLNKVSSLGKSLEPTKRNVLKMAATLFDPLGLISPVMVTLRMLLQDLCAKKYTWDSPISEEGTRLLQKWLQDVEKVNHITVRRYYFPSVTDKVKSASLHGFGDASKRAYCAMVYLCIETEDGYETSLVASKSRVAPLTPMTIPRLELIAALILARLISTVKEALDPVISIGTINCWTDSITVYYWIQSNKEYKQFVQNRIDEILKLTDASNWRHCAGIENPADIGSRGSLASDLVTNVLWWNGPSWLKEPPQNYPTLKQIKEVPDPSEECIKELRVNARAAAITANLVEETPSVKKITLSKIIDCTQFSDLTRLQRITAILLKFIKNLKARINKLPASKSKVLTAEEIKEAKISWIRESQRKLEQQPNYDNLKQQFGIYEDEDHVLRCRGRLSNSSLTQETRFPIIMPRNHPLSRLIVEACHKRVHHGGLKETLAELRSVYWIPKGRQFVKMILHQCVTCKRVQGLAFNPPQPGQLPEERVTEAAAFVHVGVDFAGPVYVKKKIGSNKEMKKAYICLFTCATSRAMHLELTPDLSTEAFIRCLRRFVARRGTPTSITSDNAKTFKRANKELVKLFKEHELQEFAGNLGINWKFILEKAPWWGGYYERMVKLVKQSLRKILGKAQLTYEEFMTVITEVEGVLNSRPITYVYSDVDEEPLTPSHLIIGRRLATLPNERELSDDEDTGTILQKRARYLSKLLEHFWKRWSREYLVDLREFHSCKSTGSTKSVQVGDVVFIKDDGLARSKWRLGKVEQLIPSKDGEVRGVSLRAVTKKGKPTKLRRPIQKLFPLEVNAGDTPMQQSSTDQQKDASIPPPRPPRRKAAMNADTIRRLVDQQ